LQHRHRRRGDFGADTVAGKNEKLHLYSSE
jgi:hypothetical protein